MAWRFVSTESLVEFYVGNSNPTCVIEDSVRNFCGCQASTQIEFHNSLVPPTILHTNESEREFWKLHKGTYLALSCLNFGKIHRLSVCLASFCDAAVSVRGLSKEQPASWKLETSEVIRNDKGIFFHPQGQPGQQESQWDESNDVSKLSFTSMNSRAYLIPYVSSPLYQKTSSDAIWWDGRGGGECIGTRHRSVKRYVLRSTYLRYAW